MKDTESTPLFPVLWDNRWNPSPNGCVFEFVNLYRWSFIKPPWTGFLSLKQKSLTMFPFHEDVDRHGPLGRSRVVSGWNTGARLRLRGRGPLWKREISKSWVT